MIPDTDAVLFSDLDLPEVIVRAVRAIGYETASPIQAATIPAMLEGADILGQAQTGTGKTTAFAGTAEGAPARPATESVHPRVRGDPNSAH